MRRLVPALIGVLFLLPADAIAQQKSSKADALPKRPKLEAGADTNDAYAYYRYGLANVDRRPRVAADAFFWASRLAPEAAEPLYGRWAALHLSDPQRLSRYLGGDERTMRQPEVQRIDSLQYLALMRNPFIHRTLEKRMLERLIPSEVWMEYSRAIQEMGVRDPALAAWVSYSDGDLPRALELYGRALKKKPDDYELHEPRARIFYITGRYDSAAVEMSQLIAEMAKRDEKQLRYLYDSKALFELGLGVVHLHLGQHDSARVAFERALTEDLSFYMAHARLATLAMATGDTARALEEMKQAVELRPDDVALRQQYGEMLLGAGNAADAATQFEMAKANNPDYAAPWFFLAALWDAQGEAATALEHFRAYVARAARGERFVPRARERITALEASTTR